MSKLLELSGVGLSFAGSKVLDGVDFDVPAGAIVSLIGPNGAGKTSLFNCITGFYKPQQGSIRLDGHETLKMKPHQVTTAGIARTFQNVRLFRQMTVRENVMSGMHCRTSAGIFGAILGLPSQRREEAEIRAFSEACLEFVGITDDWSRDASTLPYGWQRRVEIARALATKPKLVLLDEPAAGLTVSRSPAPSPPSRSSCCSTSLPPASPPAKRRSSSGSSAASATNAASPCC
jgi:branched-chain amino acid transport system ATP-binding protein